MQRCLRRQEQTQQRSARQGQGESDQADGHQGPLRRGLFRQTRISCGDRRGKARRAQVRGTAQGLEMPGRQLSKDISQRDGFLCSILT